MCEREREKKERNCDAGHSLLLPKKEKVKEEREKERKKKERIKERKKEKKEEKDKQRKTPTNKDKYWSHI